jgi:N-acetylmuramoyl-L-alanine amidase
MLNCVKFVVVVLALTISSPVVFWAQTPRPLSPAPRPIGQPLAGPAVLKSIDRTVLADALSFTLVLDRKIEFTHQWLDGPSRITVELEDATAIDVANLEFSFKDDVVRTIVVSLNENASAEVVFLLEGAASHHVYALQDPYRIVIDIERKATATVKIVPRPAPFPTPRKSPPPRIDLLVVLADEVGQPTAVSGDADDIDSVAKLEGDDSELVNLMEDSTVSSEGGVSLSRQLGLGISRVVIDPGHGGRDPGSRGLGIIEAELVLDVAIRLKTLLLAQPDIEVILTRQSNVFVPLAERTAIANNEEADLFLSIHANASLNTGARGVETFFLNFARDPEAEALAARENTGSAQRMRSLPDIVQAITLNNKLDESRDFATMVHRAMHARLSAVDRRVEDRGVKQAPFVVLIGAAMPSVLAEISFLTNQQEANLLRTDDYRQQIAEALFEGVREYQKSLRVEVVAKQ